MSKILQNFKKISYGLAPEDSKEVYEWINKLHQPNYLYINGKWVRSKSKKTIQGINPANNSKLYKLAVANKSDVNSAVNSAKNGALFYQQKDQNIYML